MYFINDICTAYQMRPYPSAALLAPGVVIEKRWYTPLHRGTHLSSLSVVTWLPGHSLFTLTYLYDLKLDGNAVSSPDLLTTCFKARAYLHTFLDAE